MNGESPRSAAWDGMDVNIFAICIKRFCEKSVGLALNSEESKEALNQILNLIDEVQKYASQNLMDDKNLAIVFAPRIGVNPQTLILMLTEKRKADELANNEVSSFSETESTIAIATEQSDSVPLPPTSPPARAPRPLPTPPSSPDTGGPALDDIQDINNIIEICNN